jgi:DNA-binding response OmpR family regulator
LISDIGMPGEDGYDLIRKVRALPTVNCGRVPAVALTAFARSEDRQRALLAGYQLHVAKPVEPSELLTVCASLVGRISSPDASWFFCKQVTNRRLRCFGSLFRPVVSLGFRQSLSDGYFQRISVRPARNWAAKGF